MPRPLYSLVALCTAAACHAPTSQVEWSYVDAPRPFDNLVVYESIQHDAREGVMFRGFETRLHQRLEACRIHTTLRHGLPDTDASDAAPSAPDGANAAAGSDEAAGTNVTTEQARLTVAPRGGTYTVVTRDRDEVTTKLDAPFTLELYDERAQKVVWRAVINVKTSSTPEIADGQDFADAVLARLRSDHVIRCAD